MSTLGNIIWFLCGGLLAWFAYVAAGLLLCLSIVGIPFGWMAIRLGFASLAPFGKQVVERPHANSTLRVLFNVAWVFLFGWEITVGHLLLALLLAITIVGIPFAKQHVKLIPLALFPFGRDLR